MTLSTHSARLLAQLPHVGIIGQSADTPVRPLFTPPWVYPARQRWTNHRRPTNRWGWVTGELHG